MDALFRKKSDRSKLVKKNERIATVFHYFSMLAPELRLIIWHMALQEQRIVVGKIALVRDNYAPIGRHEMLAGHGPPSSLLFVNWEARVEALRALTNFTFDGVTPAQELLRVNAPVDILYLRSEKITQLNEQRFGMDFDPTVRIKRLALDLSAFGTLHTFPRNDMAWDGVLFKLWALGTEEVYMVQNMRDQIMRRDIVFTKPKKHPNDTFVKTLSHEPRFQGLTRRAIANRLLPRNQTIAELEYTLLRRVHDAMDRARMIARILATQDPENERLPLLIRWIDEYIDGTWDVPKFKHVSVSTVEKERRKASSLLQRLKWW